jgi:hypothetical protein
LGDADPPTLRRAVLLEQIRSSVGRAEIAGPNRKGGHLGHSGTLQTDSPHLVQCGFSSDRSNQPVSKDEFLAEAWPAANDKSRELEWIA